MLLLAALVALPAVPHAALKHISMANMTLERMASAKEAIARFQATPLGKPTLNATTKLSLSTIDCPSTLGGGETCQGSWGCPTGECMVHKIENGDNGLALVRAAPHPALALR